ncbi:hypothetical protein LXL04_003708 [Taraxacum kok-saghyz]
MVVTAHFIDDDWVMHKRVVNFREVYTPKDEDMGWDLLLCIHNWGMKKKNRLKKDLERVPEFTDFKEIKKTIDFFEKFKTETEKVSCSTKPLVHHFTREILGIELHIRTWSTDLDLEMIGYTKKQDMTNSSIELKAREMVRETERKMESFFQTYLEDYNTGLSSKQQIPQQVVDCDDDNDFFATTIVPEV